MATVIAILIAAGYIDFKYRRCPDCNRYLNRLPIDDENCPYCGTRFD